MILTKKYQTLAIIVMAIWGIYFPSILTNDFVGYWDDYGMRNHFFITNDFSWDNFQRIFLPEMVIEEARNAYRNDLVHAGHGIYAPFTFILIKFLTIIFGDNNPIAFHAVRVVFHSVSVWLVFIFIKMLFKNESYATSLAFIVAILSGIHPMHVESVAWFAEIKDGYSIPYLGALVAYLHYRDKKYWLGFFVTGILFITACLFKGMAVTLPLALLAIDVFQKRISWYSLSEKIPFFAVSLWFGMVAIDVQQTIGVPDMNQLSFWGNYTKIGYGLAVYLYKVVIPHPLAAVYPANVPLWAFVIPILLGIIVVIVRKSPIILFGILFFLIHIGPVVTRGDVGYLQDHYAYVSYWGLYIVLGYGFIKIQSLTIQRIALGIFIGVLSISTFRQTFIWKDELTLFRHVQKNYPDMTSSVMCERWKGLLILESNRLRTQKYFRESIAVWNEMLKLPCLSQDERIMIKIFIAMNYVSLDEIDASKAIYDTLISQGVDVRAFQKIIWEQSRQNKQGAP